MSSSQLACSIYSNVFENISRLRSLLRDDNHPKAVFNLIPLSQKIILFESNLIAMIFYLLTLNFT